MLRIVCQGDVNTQNKSHPTPGSEAIGEVLGGPEKVRRKGKEGEPEKWLLLLRARAADGSYSRKEWNENRMC